MAVVESQMYPQWHLAVSALYLHRMCNYQYAAYICFKQSFPVSTDVVKCNLFNLDT